MIFGGRRKKKANLAMKASVNKKRGMRRKPIVKKKGAEMSFAKESERGGRGLQMVERECQSTKKKKRGQQKTARPQKKRN